MRTASASNQGPRERLEDAAHVFSIRLLQDAVREAIVMMVLDGVGGLLGGDIASSVGAAQVGAYLAGILAADSGSWGSSRLSPEALLEVIRQSLTAANEAVCAHGRTDSALDGMATTIVCGVIIDGKLHLAWAGDSRCYLYRRGLLVQLTTDHREVEQLVDVGLISREQAAVHPLAHNITRYLGNPDEFTSATVVCALRAGDVVLMCSDGLTDAVADQEIANTISACQSNRFAFEELATQLVAQALRANTRDNVTVVCCTYEREDQPISLIPDGTLTGAYPASLAISRQCMRKESCNE